MQPSVWLLDHTYLFWRLSESSHLYLTWCAHISWLVNIDATYASFPGRFLTSSDVQLLTHSLLLSWGTLIKIFELSTPFHFRVKSHCGQTDRQARRTIRFIKRPHKDNCIHYRMLVLVAGAMFFFTLSCVCTRLCRQALGKIRTTAQRTGI